MRNLDHLRGTHGQYSSREGFIRENYGHDIATYRARTNDVPPVKARLCDKAAQCAYCYASVWESPTVDDIDWEREARQHFEDCDWLITRAHTREMPR